MLVYILKYQKLSSNQHVVGVITLARMLFINFNAEMFDDAELRFPYFFEN